MLIGLARENPPRYFGLTADQVGGLALIAVSLFLLVADFVYFDALRNPEALVSLVSSLRRGSTLVGFAGGLLLFGEKNGLQKLPAVIGILVGIVLTVLG